MESHQFGVVVKAVEDLPEEDERHEEKVARGHHRDPTLQVFDQLFPLVDLLVVILQVPLVEWCPWSFEEKPLHVEPETLAEEDDVTGGSWQGKPHWQQVFVHQCHLFQKKFSFYYILE